MKTKQILKLAAALAVVCCILLSGCGEGIDNDVRPEDSYRIIEIDGCEYIFISCRPFDREMSIAHKGNCKNPQH